MIFYLYHPILNAGLFRPISTHNREALAGDYNITIVIPAAIYRPVEKLNVRLIRHCLVAGLRSEEVVGSSVHETRRPPQRTLGRGESRYLGERADADTRALFRGSTSFNGVVSTAAAGPTPRRSRERGSRAAHQNATRSEDGVSPPTHRETRCRRHGVSRRCWRLSDCFRTPRIERLTQLYRPEPH